jgi:hypothetical protein
LTENIKNTLNGVFEEKYGITISYVRLVWD